LPQTIDRALGHDLRAGVHRPAAAPEDFDPLMTLVGDARFVLIGEASHRPVQPARVDRRRAPYLDLRDRHMAETLDALVAFHAGRGRREKVVVWAFHEMTLLRSSNLPIRSLAHPG
jgi:erythromycin esterase-like protein